MEPLQITRNVFCEDYACYLTSCYVYDDRCREANGKTLGSNTPTLFHRPFPNHVLRRAIWKDLTPTGSAPLWNDSHLYHNPSQFYYLIQIYTPFVGFQITILCPSKLLHRVPSRQQQFRVPPGNSLRAPPLSSALNQTTTCTVVIQGVCYERCRHLGRRQRGNLPRWSDSCFGGHLRHQLDLRRQ